MFKKIHKTIVVEGMHCEGCANRVQNILTMIPGVKQVKVNLEDRRQNLFYLKKLIILFFERKLKALDLQ